MTLTGTDFTPVGITNRLKFVGHQVDGPLPHLQPLGFALRQACDELGLTVEGGPTQVEFRRHGKAPAGGHAAGDPVLQGKTLTIEVEPQVALQLQPVRFRLGIAPSHHVQAQRRARGHLIGWERMPGWWQPGLARIHLDRTLHLHQSQRRLCLEAPGLLPGPGFGLSIGVQFGDIVRAQGVDLQIPLSRPQLHP